MGNTLTARGKLVEEREKRKGASWNENPFQLAPL